MDVATAIEGARRFVWKAAWYLEHEPEGNDGPAPSPIPPVTWLQARGREDSSSEDVDSRRY